MDGDLFIPVPAADVVGAEFKNRTVVQRIDVDRLPSDDLPDLEFSRFPPAVELRVSQWTREGDAQLNLWIELRGDDGDRFSLFALPEFLDQVVHGKRWYPLIPEELTLLRETLEAAGISELGPISLRQYLAIQRQDRFPVAQSDRAIEAADEPRTPNRILVLPESLVQANLYDYQKIGVAWLVRLSGEDLGCILGDEMGLGKTLQIITLVAYEIELGRKPNLVTCPATLLENWRRELQRFAPQLEVCMHVGQDRTGFPTSLRRSDVVLVPYDTAVRDLSLLKMIDWNVVVIDEAQAIKNPETLRASAMCALPRRTGIAVTGTPVENRLRDLWSIMEFALPGFLGPLDSFESEFLDDSEGARRLEPIVTPLLLRRMVMDVATELPDKIEVPLPIALDDDGARAYENLRVTIAEEYGRSAGLVSLTKLRMFCAHPYLITSEWGDLPSASSKYSQFLDVVDEIVLARHKVIVFTSFTQMTDLMLEDLNKRYSAFVDHIDGRVAVSERQGRIDRFSAFDGSAILLLNPRAAGTGLNITAARHVIHYTLEWNPAIEDQATARAYRRGQSHPVTVHRLFHSGTVEEVIDNRLQRKRLLAESAVVGTTGNEDDADDLVRALGISPLRKRSN